MPGFMGGSGRRNVALGKRQRAEARGDLSGKKREELIDAFESMTVAELKEMFGDAELAIPKGNKAALVAVAIANHKHFELV